LAHLADLESVDAEHSLLHGAPLSHGSGLYMLPYIARGARHVIPASGAFDPPEFFELCGQHPACSTFLAPTMVQRFRLEAERRGGYAPANLRSIFYGGGPMDVDELKHSLAVFGQVFIQVYGQGESPMTITAVPRSEHLSADDRVLGSVGWARTGVEVKVVDADDRAVAPGTIGEIICRGDVVMQGYWQNPDATASTLRGGWLHTGDVGVMDASGMLTLQGRSKEVIISGGTNIYPREVEEALTAHPDVLECAVIGEPDPEWGENVVAFIVRRTGTTVSSADLDRHCLDQIARFKRPKSYVFVEALPKNNYGKVVKRDLASFRG
jgi:acyl-CoA synthetase (AMP-forming)/AMP-acid ligase II